MCPQNQRIKFALAQIGTTWLLALAAILPATASAAPIAIVTDVQGRATITTDGRAVDATIATEIEPGAQLQLQANATLVLLYFEAAAEYAFRGPAQAVLRTAQPEMISGAAAVRRSPGAGPAIRIKPVGLGQGALVMRSGQPGARIRLLSASGTRVLETQPEFRWLEPQPGLTYQVEIADDTGRLLHEAQVAGAALRLPVGMQLKEGASYSWAVSARLPDGRKYSSVGDFSVAGAELRAQAAALRATVDAGVSSRVTYAVWLDQAELKDEARKLWRVLAAERPDDEQLKALAAR